MPEFDRRQVVLIDEDTIEKIYRVDRSLHNRRYYFDSRLAMEAVDDDENTKAKLNVLLELEKRKNDFSLNR